MAELSVEQQQKEIAELGKLLFARQLYCTKLEEELRELRAVFKLREINIKEWQAKYQELRAKLDAMEE